MPLLKKGIVAVIEQPKPDEPTSQPLTSVQETKKMVNKAAKTLSKDDYWTRKEERDLERDKHMAWSGLAQAALGSVSVAQLNTDNTEDGLVILVSRIVDKLLKVRDGRP